VTLSLTKGRLDIKRNEAILIIPLVIEALEMTIGGEKRIRFLLKNFLRFENLSDRNYSCNQYAPHVTLSLTKGRLSKLITNKFQKSILDCRAPFHFARNDRM